MPDLHIASSTTTPSTLDRLQSLRERGPGEDFAAFESEVRALLAELEREVVAEGLEQLDIGAPAVLIDGVEHRRVVRCEGVYFTRAGEVRLERSL